MSYVVAAADEYLAVTGGGVKTVKICKSIWVHPWQKVNSPLQIFRLLLTTYSVNVSVSNLMIVSINIINLVIKLAMKSIAQIYLCVTMTGSFPSTS